MKNGAEYLTEWGVEDPKMIGSSEYHAVYETLSDALTGCEDVADTPTEFACAILDEFIEAAKAIKAKVLQAEGGRVGLQHPG